MVGGHAGCKIMVTLPSCFCFSKLSVHVLEFVFFNDLLWPVSQWIWVQCNEIRKVNGNLIVIGRTTADVDKEDCDNDADDDEDDGEESEGDQFEQETSWLWWPLSILISSMLNHSLPLDKWIDTLCTFLLVFLVRVNFFLMFDFFLHLASGLHES